MTIDVTDDDTIVDKKRIDQCSEVWSAGRLRRDIDFRDDDVVNSNLDLDEKILRMYVANEE